MNVSRRTLFPAVLLLSAAALSYETLLPRVSAVYVGPNFVYFLVSIALVGLSSGGIAASLWGDRFVDRPHRNLAALSLLFAISVVLVSWLTYQAGQTLNATLDARYVDVLTPAADRTKPIPSGVVVVPSVLFVLGVGAATAVPFLFAGLCLALVFRMGSPVLARLYGFDLFGAGLGCLLTVIALTWLSATNALVLVAVLGAAAGLLFALPEGAEGRRPRTLAASGGALGTLLALLLFGVSVRSPFEFRPLKYQHLRSYSDGPARETEFRWTPIGRVSLLERMWSPSLNLTPRVRPKHFVAMDLGGHSVVEDFTPESLEIIKHTSLFTDDAPEAFVLPGLYRPRLRDYLVLMAGNGQDLLRLYAWHGDRVHLQGMELNPVVYDFGFHYPPARLRAFFDQPNVRMFLGEGRVFVERSPRTYDVIVLSYDGATFATGTGSLASTPQFLFTREAFLAYLRKPNLGGVLVIAGGCDPDELPASFRTFASALRTFSPKAEVPRHIISYQLKGAPATPQYTCTTGTRSPKGRSRGSERSSPPMAWS